MRVQKNNILNSIIGYATILLISMIVITTVFATAYYEDADVIEDDILVVEVPIEEMTKPESLFDNDNYYNMDNVIESVEDDIEVIIDETEEEIVEVEEEEIQIEDTVYHTVEKNDSYWSISDLYYESGTYSTRLAEYNGKNVNAILNIGDVLEIPELDEDDNFVGQVLKEETQASSVQYSLNNTSNNSAKNYTDYVDTSTYEYIGLYNITGYTPGCVHCCGNDAGITASGNVATVGYTVAASSNLPFGTNLYIEDYGYYVVEDRGGFNSNVLDIAAASHEDCYELTASGVDVYIVPTLGA